MHVSTRAKNRCLLGTRVSTCTHLQQNSTNFIVFVLPQCSRDPWGRLLIYVTSYGKHTSRPVGPRLSQEKKGNHYFNFPQNIIPIVRITGTVPVVLFTELTGLE